jgi:hypothetical protein
MNRSTFIACSRGLLVAAFIAASHSIASAADVTGDRLNIGTGHTLSGTTSSIAGGNQNTVPGNQSFIGSGTFNYVSGTTSVVGGGNSNTNISSIAVIGGGFHNYAAGLASFIGGGADAYTTLLGQSAHAAGAFTTVGDAQTCEYVSRVISTNPNSELFLNGSSLRLVVPTNGVWAFDVTVVFQAANGDAAAFKTNGLVKNINGTMSLVGGPITVAPYAADAAASAWTVGLSADQANTSLDIVGNSDSLTNRWVATIHTTEVRY